MNFRKLVVSFAVVVSLGGCGVEEGFEDLVDIVESDEKEPSSRTRTPSSGDRGATQVPATDSSDFVGSWETHGALISTQWGEDGSRESPLTGNSPLLAAGDRRIVYRIGQCDYPARITDRFANFESGFRCFERNSEGIMIAYTVEKGEMERLHADHLFVGLRLNWETTELRSNVGGTVVLVAELVRNGHPPSSREK